MTRVTNFILSHQMAINMWPWHEFQQLLYTELSNSFLFIFLRVFVQYFLIQEKFIDQKLVLFFFFIPSPSLVDLLFVQSLILSISLACFVSGSLPWYDGVCFFSSASHTLEAFTFFFCHRWCSGVLLVFFLLALCLTSVVDYEHILLWFCLSYSL